MTSVWVLTRDVPYEFGEVRGVFATEELADAELERLAKSRKGDDKYVSRSELDVEEWEVQTAE